MSGTSFYIIVVLMIAVFIVLLAGLRNMLKGGDANFSNKMMQLRVFLQFIAVVAIVIVVYFARQAS
jgi:predicted secreted protein